MGHNTLDVVIAESLFRRFIGSWVSFFYGCFIDEGNNQLQPLYVKSFAKISVSGRYRSLPPTNVDKGVSYPTLFDEFLYRSLLWELSNFISEELCLSAHLVSHHHPSIDRGGCEVTWNESFHTRFFGRHYD